MQGLTALTNIAIGVYSLFFILMTIGHIHELETGVIEGFITKIGSFIMVFIILIPIIGMVSLIHILQPFVTPSGMEDVMGIIVLLSYVASIVMVILTVSFTFDLAHFIYTRILNRTPHERWD